MSDEDSRPGRRTADLLARAEHSTVVRLLGIATALLTLGGGVFAAATNYAQIQHAVQQQTELSARVSELGREVSKQELELRLLCLQALGPKCRRGER